MILTFLMPLASKALGFFAPIGAVLKIIPPKIWIMLIAGAVLLFSGYTYGKRSEALKQEKIHSAAIEKLVKAQNKMQQEQLKITEEYYQHQLKLNVRNTHEIKEVIKYVESDSGQSECLDSDGVYLINSIIAKDV